MFAANTKGFKNESKYLGQKNYEVTNAVINIQDRTIFDPVILSVLYSSLLIFTWSNYSFFILKLLFKQSNAVMSLVAVK